VPLFRKREVDVYDEEGEYIGKGYVMKEGKMIVGCNITTKDGNKIFEDKENLIVFKFGVVRVPKIDNYEKIKEKIEYLKEKKEKLLLECGKLVARRMIGDMLFSDFSKLMKETSRKCEIISAVIERYESMRGRVKK